ncbi:MAG: 6-bladed beta-propeller [Marinifilaceae bacterium]
MEVNIHKDEIVDLENRISIKEIVSLDNRYPLGKVTKASFTKDKIIVLDKQSEEIFAYNRKGEFLFKISDKGKGPNEYTHIQSFFIDKFNRKIKVLEGTGKILVYDWTGNFNSVEIADKDLSFSQIMNAMQLDANTEIHCGLGPDFNLAICNSHSGENHKFLPFNEIRDYSFSFKAFSTCENSVLFCHGMNDSIYSIDREGVNANYYVDFKENKIAPALYKGNPQVIDEKYENQVVAVKLDQLNETLDQVLFSYWVFDVKNSKGMKTQFAVYNKSENKTYNVASESAFFPVNDVVENQLCASLVPPVKLLHSERKNQQINEYLDRNEISEDQNPLVLLWELK